MQGSNKTLTGLLWSFAERFSAQFISFVVSIILARLLIPSDYGIIAMVMIFINIANALVTGGFGNSLIQKKNADDLDFSTIFYFNICFSIGIYYLIFIFAPLIENFYHQEGLALITRILGLRVLLTGINSIQRAFVARRMQFKLFFFATFGGTIVSAIIGILMAYSGFGVWALVAQYLINSTVDTVVLWFTVRWRPKLVFSFSRLKELVSYGWKLLCSSLLSTLYTELNSLVIGKYYSASDLAYYNKGKSFPALFVTNINTAIETVIFPAMSRNQDNKSALKEKTKKSMQLSTFFIFPIVFGMAGASETIIVALLTEKWIEASLYMGIACSSFALVPVGMANLQAIKAVGRSDVYLKLDILKKLIGITLLVLVLPYGVRYIALAEAISNILGFLINLLPNRSIMNYKFFEQLKDVAPSFVLSVIMAIGVFTVGLLNIPVWPKLILQIIFGMLLYFGLAFLFRLEALSDIKRIVRGLK